MNTIERRRLAVKQGLAVAVLSFVAYVVTEDVAHTAFAAFLVFCAVVWMEA